MNKKTNIKTFVRRAAMTLLVALTCSASAWAQYVFVIANPSGSGEVRVGKTTDLGSYHDGSHFIFDAEPGETIYFDFNAYSGWQFTGTITNDADLTDITLLDNGLYSFTMPEYEGTSFINIQIQFEEETVVVEGVNINEDNFPDVNFRKYLLAQSYGADAVITDEEMAGITKISAPSSGILDLTGIEYFTQLTSINVGNSITTPEENKNKITSINLSTLSKLRTLWCSDNQIGSLDFSQCPDMRDLQCSNNLLTELDVTNCQSLRSLDCTDNQLTTLDVTQNPDMAVLACYGNQLTELNVTNNLLLEQLYCENNQLTSIDVSNHDKLQNFNCNNNQLTSLNLSGCTQLYHLYCYNNKIKEQAMTDLVSSLETPPNGGYMVIIDLKSEIEENEMSEEQAAAARAKGWSVEAWLIDDSVPYPYDENDHQYVDLGLPSGTLWATCNVGAIQPYHSGLFFAWGDTEGHGSDPEDGYSFNWENYKWCEVSGEDTDFTKYCSDSSRGKDGFTDGKYELDPEDDAAYVNWGPQWRMPTKEQFDELRNECNWTRMLLGDVWGYDVEGPNGNSFFLPDTGWRIDDQLLEGGAYWSLSGDPEDVGGAFYLGFDEYNMYDFGGRLDGQCVRPVIWKTVNLADNADNSAVIEAAAENAGSFDVKLGGRTLYKDGSWNTLCLPFALDAAQTAESLDNPEAIMTLSTSSFDNGTLTLNFVDATTIEAGKPYIVKWAEGDGDIVEPTFTGVTIVGEPNDITTDIVTFKGLYSPLSIGAEGDKTLLYIGADNMLYYPGGEMIIGSQRAYLQLASGYICGEPTYSEPNGVINSFVVNLGEDGTGIGEMKDERWKMKDDTAAWYDLSGRKFDSKPQTKGIYINNGHKVVIE